MKNDDFYSFKIKAENLNIGDIVRVINHIEGITTNYIMNGFLKVIYKTDFHILVLSENNEPYYFYKDFFTPAEDSPAWFKEFQHNQKLDFIDMVDAAGKTLIGWFDDQVERIKFIKNKERYFKNECC